MKMLSRMLAVLTILSLPFFVIGLPHALAQGNNEPTGFKNVHLWLNPEYDDPRLLVMLEGQIDGVEAPATVRFLVPSAAEMYSAGSIDSTGKYSGGPPARQESSLSGWDEISYEVKTGTFRVEYYDPHILGQTEKSISYEFRRLYPISSLQVIIQEPRSATGFTVTPAGSPYIDNEGFNTLVYSYTNLAADTALVFQISYVKTDTLPSLDIKNSGASSPLVITIIVVVLVLIIAGVFFWLRKSGAKRTGARRQLLRPNATRQVNRFCGQCGKPVDPSHSFCPHCGARLP